MSYRPASRSWSLPSSSASARHCSTSSRKASATRPPPSMTPWRSCLPHFPFLASAFLVPASPPALSLEGRSLARAPPSALALLSVAPLWPQVALQCSPLGEVPRRFQEVQPLRAAAQPSRVVPRPPTISARSESPGLPELQPVQGPSPVLQAAQPSPR